MSATNGPPQDEIERVATGAPEKGRTWLLPLLILIPALFALAMLIRTIAGSGSPSEMPTIRGVRLGMTADQVRQRFERGAQASWRTEIAGTDMTLIRAAGGSLDREARFEFHDGMLVAIRMDLPSEAPEASGDRIAISPASVTSRTIILDGRTSLAVLARDCPTHAEEVSRILSDAP